VLKRNPNWWGLSQGKKPTLTEIDFTEFKSGDTAYAAYQAGQFDIGFPTTQLLAQAKTQPDFHQVGTLTYYGINFNWQKPPFNNLDARTAFCLAINRDQLNSAILKNAVSPHWNIVPKGMPGYNPSTTGPDGVTATAGDQAKAKQHWQTYQSSAGGAAPAITYLYVSGSTSQQQLAEALQSQWQQALGVNVTLKGEDFNTYLSDSNTGNFIATRFGWIADYPDPQDFLTLLFDTNAQYNSQKASVPQADTLMRGADTNSNQSARMQAYNQAEQLLVNQVATCPLYQGINFYQVRSYVNNWLQDAAGSTPNDNWVATTISNH
jgi:peptide/nickel transport system substrate-binding protein/oligopeptide transport system substrate-binding protein